MSRKHVTHTKMDPRYIAMEARMIKTSRILRSEASFLDCLPKNSCLREPHLLLHLACVQSRRTVLCLFIFLTYPTHMVVLSKYCSGLSLHDTRLLRLLCIPAINLTLVPYGRTPCHLLSDQHLNRLRCRSVVRLLSDRRDVVWRGTSCLVVEVLRN